MHTSVKLTALVYESSACQCFLESLIAFKCAVSACTINVLSEISLRFVQKRGITEHGLPQRRAVHSKALFASAIKDIDV